MLATITTNHSLTKTHVYARRRYALLHVQNACERGEDKCAQHLAVLTVHTHLHACNFAKRYTGDSVDALFTLKRS